MKKLRVGPILILAALSLVLLIALAACAGPTGDAGPAGPAGPQGPAGQAGPAGEALDEAQLKALDTAAAITGIFPQVEDVRRGCPACHVLVDKESGKYTLPFEAHERAEARGEEHPDTAPDGTSIKPTDDVNVTVCLQCHAAGEGSRAGQGVVAPLALRDIVHPAHMSSPFFNLHYRGNCFTCHNVDGTGAWQLLTEKVETNDKGVPNPDDLPIPGAVDIVP